MSEKKMPLFLVLFNVGLVQDAWRPTGALCTSTAEQFTVLPEGHILLFKVPQGESDPSQSWVFSSDDDGVNWTQRQDLLTYSNFTPLNNDNLLSLSEYPQVLKKSTDGGTSWRRINTPTDVWDLLSVDWLDGFWRISQTNSLLRSTDNGRTWAAADGGTD
jgi:hypothetical protein